MGVVQKLLKRKRSLKPKRKRENRLKRLLSPFIEKEKFSRTSKNTNQN